METRGAVTCQVRNGEKFKILLIAEHVVGKQSRKLSVYRRHEYGEWPQAVIDTICGAFGMLYAASEKQGMSKALSFIIEGRRDVVAVLFSTGNETRDPYKGRPIFYNERPAESALMKDLYAPPSESKQDAISVRRQRSFDGAREILVISKIMNPEEPINVWRTETISIARRITDGLWTEARAEQLIQNFDKFHRRYSKDGDRQPTILEDPDCQGPWILSYFDTSETQHGVIYALLHELV